MSPLNLGIDLIFTSKKIFFSKPKNFEALKFGPALFSLIASYHVSCRFLSVVLILSLLVKKIFFIFFQKKSASIFWTGSSCRLLTLVLILSLLVKKIFFIFFQKNQDS
jgi:hypothetical protein